MKRPFNRSAYNKYDNANKLMVIKIFQKKGYSVAKGLTEELYKECDIILYNDEKDKYIRIENESREDFDKIKNRFSTIHIPIRKKDTKANFYFVWKPNQTECMIIDIDECREFNIFNNIQSVVCSKDRNLSAYEEDFIDVPKIFAYICQVDSDGNITSKDRDKVKIDAYKRNSQVGNYFKVDPNDLY